jgi:choline kinase
MAPNRIIAYCATRKSAPATFQHGTSKGFNYINMPNRSIRRAIILAAGMNLRLRKIISAPKTLLRIGEYTLLERILHSCTLVKISQIVIVVGYKSEEIERYLKESDTYSNFGIRTIHNPEYENKNNILSFWLARKEMNEPFVLFNSDVLFHENIISLLINGNAQSALMIDDRKKLGLEEMKVVLNSTGLIIDISKSIDPLRANGEYIGMAKFADLEITKKVLARTKLLLDTGRTDVFYEEVLRLISAEEPCINGLSTKGLPWIEIDTPQDYEKAKRMLNTEHGSLL